MSADLPKSPYPYAVQRPLSLQPREGPLDSLPLSIDRSPANRLDGSSHRLLVSPVRVDDGLRTVLPPNKPSQRLAGVAFVRDDSHWMEGSIGEPSLREQIRRSLRVMDVTSRNVGCNREPIIFTVCHEVQLVAELVLILSMRVLLDAPTSIRVGHLGLARVAPSFERGRVYRHALAKARQCLIVAAHQCTRHTLEQRKSRFLGEPCKEPAERILVGDILWRLNTTGVCDERVTLQSANHFRRGRQAEVVLGDETLPKNANRMPFWPSAYRANQLVNQRVVGQCRKERLKFTDNRGRLNGRASGGRVNGDQREANTFLSGLENTGVSAPVFSSFVTPNIRRKSSKVNCRGRTFTTNWSPILTSYRKSIVRCQRLRHNYGVEVGGIEPTCRGVVNPHGSTKLPPRVESRAIEALTRRSLVSLVASLRSPRRVPQGRLELPTSGLAVRPSVLLRYWGTPQKKKGPKEPRSRFSGPLFVWRDLGSAYALFSCGCYRAPHALRLGEAHGLRE